MPQWSNSVQARLKKPWQYTTQTPSRHWRHVFQFNQCWGVVRSPYQAAAQLSGELIQPWKAMMPHFNITVFLQERGTGLKIGDGCGWKMECLSRCCVPDWLCLEPRLVYNVSENNHSTVREWLPPVETFRGWPLGTGYPLFWTIRCYCSQEKPEQVVAWIDAIKGHFPGSSNLPGMEVFDAGL